MKKSTLNLMTLALVLVNVVLSVLLTFSILSTSQKTDALITKISNLIDLDINGVSVDTPDLTDLETLDVTANDNPKITVTLEGSDKKIHHVVVTASVILNKKSSDYETKKPTIEGNMKLITSIISEVLSDYKSESIVSNKSKASDQILARLQDVFKTEMVYGFTFGDFIVQ